MNGGAARFHDQSCEHHEFDRKVEKLRDTEGALWRTRACLVVAVAGFLSAVCVLWALAPGAGV